MFSRILVCVDGSERSVAAARAAAELAKAQGASLTLLHVSQAPRDVAAFPGAPTLPAAAVEQYVQALHEAVIERTRPAVEEVGLSFEVLQETGEPVPVIVRTAETRGFNLVVMGSRGLGEEKAARLGSVSDGVAHRAQCPVLLVK
ncbi:MAG: Universal stress protein UspA-like nucleotide-binding protein [Armatimonadetes bacterium]|jgi:nucleotide-binding universal stress UspA family protein|nr:Universal stress protein UspA-like nucleotide-binding protein [Armatimonadota bacterium]